MEEPPSRTAGLAEVEILSLFERWNEAMVGGDSAAVAALYADDAVLLPTLSNRIRRDREGIASYFKKFITWAPRSRLLEGAVRLFGDVAVHSGAYRFTFGSGPFREVDARFTFVYARRQGSWRIVEHHSSMMPEVERLKPARQAGSLA